MTMQISIYSDQDGKRLDQALAELTESSRSHITKLITAGNVTGSGTIKASRKVKLGESYEINNELPAEIQASHTPVDIPSQILHEDDSLLVIDKKVGQVVHPGPGQREGTIAENAAVYCPTIKDAINYQDENQRETAMERAGIVHRLDKDTSGVIIIAKTKKALINLQHQFAGREVVKMYSLICNGKLDSQIVNRPIDRHPKKKFLRTVLTGGKEAVTEFKVVKVTNTKVGDITLAEAYPKTGRTHQIRVHIKWLNHPILGDNLYGSKSSLKQTSELNISRMLLHASSITIKHPDDNKSITFSSKLPVDFSTVMISSS